MHTEILRKDGFCRKIQTFTKFIIKEDLLNEDVIVIGTIYYESYPWVDDLKKMPQVELVEITLEN